MNELSTSSDNPFVAQAFARNLDEAPMWRWLEGDVSMHATGDETGDRYQIEVFTTHNGQGPEAHIHGREDEWYYLISGGPLKFTAGDKSVELKAGSYINLSSGWVHEYKNVGEDGRLVCSNAPAGFDRFQKELVASWPPGDLDMKRIGPQMIDLARKYGMDFSPDQSSFGETAKIRVVEPGAEQVDIAPGVGAVVLARPSDTGGRHASVRLNLADHAEPFEISHSVVSTGLLVVEGTVRIVIDGRERELSTEGFAHLEPGDTAKVSASTANASLLVWHAPGLAIPFVGGQ